MIGIYLSGTGNTKHCIEKLIHVLDETAQAVPMEEKQAAELLSQHEFIVLAYPVQYSNVPVMVRDFIKNHSSLWKRIKRSSERQTERLKGGRERSSVAGILRMVCTFTTGSRAYCASVYGFCTMCYRCISSYPAQAITLLGDRVIEQCRYDRYYVD